MGKIYLIRHGESELNIHGDVLCGWLDVELTEKGKRQAMAIAQRLKMSNIAKVYSSDLKRATATAKMIAEVCGAELVIERRLREINYGDWEGLSYEAIENSCEEWKQMLRTRKEDATKFKPPNGEAFLEFAKRVTNAFDEIATAHRGENVAIVAHKMTNRVILCHALGISPALWFTIAQEEACVNEILTDDSFGYVVECVNDLCHLTEV
jgi:broad specificity phosphatase PhoE